MANYPNGLGTNTIPTFPPNSLAPGETITLWNAETPAVGTASVQFAIAKGPVEGYPASVSLELLFSAAPGAFEVDLQEADTDADIFYQTIGANNITAVGGNQTARLEAVPVKGRFCRALLKTRTNVVAITLRAFR